MEVGDILYSLFSLINPSAFGQQTAELVTYGVGACPQEPPDFLIGQAEAIAQGEKLPLLVPRSRPISSLVRQRP